MRILPLLKGRLHNDNASHSPAGNRLVYLYAQAQASVITAVKVSGEGAERGSLNNVVT